MHRIANILLLCAALLSSSWAFAHGNHVHGSKKKKKEAKQSEHVHNESPWSFSLGAGVSTSYALTKNEPEAAAAASAPRGLALDEGHDHGSEGGGGEGGGSSDETTLSPYVSASVQYMLSHKWSLGLSTGYGLEGGLFDPSLFVSFTTKLSRSLSLPVSFGASLPLSDRARRSSRSPPSLSAGGQCTGSPSPSASERRPA